MAIRFERLTGTQEQHAAVLSRFQGLMKPDAALALIRRHVCADAVAAKCTAARHPTEGIVAGADGKAGTGQGGWRAGGAPPWDRFVIRVDVELADGGLVSYVLKGYADGRGEGIGEFYRALSGDFAERDEPCPVITPFAYLGDEQLLIMPWVSGISLEEVIRAGHTEMIADAIAHAPRALATLHTAQIVPEPPTTAETMVRLTGATCEKHYEGRPEARKLVTPLTDLLQAALPHLERTTPTVVHGDPGPGNFILGGKGWLLLDLDGFGYADPAYDVGYLLAKLDYARMMLSSLDAGPSELVAQMQHSCLAAMPAVSARNVAFFHGMALIRKALVPLMRAAPLEEWSQWSSTAAQVAMRTTTILNGMVEDKS